MYNLDATLIGWCMLQSDQTVIADYQHPNSCWVPIVSHIRNFLGNG